MLPSLVVGDGNDFEEKTYRSCKRAFYLSIFSGVIILPEEEKFNLF